MGNQMSSYRYQRFKANREENANTFDARCARYFAQDLTPDDPGESAYGTLCPCDRSAPAAMGQEVGCEYLTFDQLPPEQQKVYVSTQDQVFDGLGLALVVLFVLWVFRVWIRTRREERARAEEARAAAEEEEAKWLAGLSGRKFVRVQQPDTSVELAEIVVGGGDGTGDEKTLGDTTAGVVAADGGETS